LYCLYFFVLAIVLVVLLCFGNKVSLKTGNHLLYWTMLDKILRN
jgi:hypothetical protein